MQFACLCLFVSPEVVPSARPVPRLFRHTPCPLVVRVFVLLFHSEVLELARTRTHSCWSAWKTCLLWSVFGPPSVRFFLSLALPRSARFGLGVWCWCFLFFFPFFFCVPRLVSRLGKVSSHVHGHFIFMSISPTLLRQGVCVCVTSKQM